MSMRLRIAIGVVALIAVIGGGFFWYHTTSSGPYRITQAFERIRTLCAKEAYVFGCYDRVLPTLLDTGFTMEEAFAVANQLVAYSAKNGSYFYCHIGAHGIAAKETAKDPSLWTKVVARCPEGLCANGCIHGAAQERFRKDRLTETEVTESLSELRSICASNPHMTKLEITGCHHALGHLSLYLASGDVPQALRTCRAISFPHDLLRLRTCYEGVFMQVYQPAEPEDKALVRAVAPTSTEAIAGFCAPYSGAELSACRTESWPLYGIPRLLDPKALTAFCALSPGKLWTSRCYNDLFYIFAVTKSFEPKALISYCDQFAGEVRMQCFGNVATAAIEADHRFASTALAVCKAAEERGIGTRCYDDLLIYSDYDYLPHSEAFTAFCTRMPEPYRSSCLNGDGARTKPYIEYK